MENNRGIGETPIPVGPKPTYTTYRKNGRGGNPCTDIHAMDRAIQVTTVEAAICSPSVSSC